MKAVEWLQRGDETSDYFDKLSNYWRGFNNLFSGAGRERALITDFISGHLSESFAQNLIDEKESEINILVGTPVLDMRGNGRDTSRYISQYHSSASAIDKLINIFMVIYQIRCNFEHGEKSPSRDRDLQLCTAACPFVAEVIRVVT